MDVGRIAVVVAFGSVVAAIAAEPALPPVESPAENVPSDDKRVLGKILFFEEQLSADNSMACATCHVMERGGTDARRGISPGRDESFGNTNDVFGSPGVRPMSQDGDFDTNSAFGIGRQVTGRTTPSPFGASYSDAILWDGRAGETFVDPITNEVVVEQGGALESQALLPLVNSAEMGHLERQFPEILAKLARVTPLALAERLPPDVAQALYGNPSYAELFRRAFGDSQITAARVALAISDYERTLVPNQTDYDRFIAGDANALSAAEQRGLAAFNEVGCAECHAGPLFTDNSFRVTGVRPNRDDGGVANVSSDTADRGKFKVPSLRNTALKRSFFHDGRRSTLHEAVKFYNRVDGPSKPRPDIFQNQTGNQAGGTVTLGNSDPTLDSGLLGPPIFIDPFDPGDEGEPTAGYGGGEEPREPTEVQFVDNQDPLMATIHMTPQQMADIEAFLEGGLVDTRVQDQVAPFDRPILASENPDLGPTLSGLGRSSGTVPTIAVSTPAVEGTTEFQVGIAGATPNQGARLIMWQDGGAAAETTPTVTLQPSIAAGGIATVSPDISNVPAGTTLHFVWQVDDPDAPGGVALSRTLNVPVFEARSASVPVAGERRARLNPPEVDDRNAYVARAAFTVDWAAHKRGDDNDTFSVTGVLNPRGMGADLSQGRLTLSLGGREIVSGLALDASGAVHTGAVDVSFDPEIGTLSIALRGADLDEAFAATHDAERGRTAVPFVASLTGLGLTESTVATDLQFTWRRKGDRSTGKFGYSKDGASAGAFRLTDVTTKAEEGGLHVRAQGVFDAPAGERPTFADGVELSLGTASKFTLRADQLRINKRGLVTATESGALRSLRIDLRTRTFSFDVTINDPVTNGVPFGTIVSLPIRLDTEPKTSGPAGVFETVAEIRLE